VSICWFTGKTKIIKTEEFPEEEKNHFISFIDFIDEKRKEEKYVFMKSVFQFLVPKASTVKEAQQSFSSYSGKQPLRGSHRV
jgi:hypothetical protein